MGAYSHFERGTRLIILTLRGVKHREVIVRLGQFRKVFRQRSEDLDSVRCLVLLDVNQALEKARTCIFRTRSEYVVDTLHGLRVLAGADQALGLLIVVALGGCG